MPTVPATVDIQFLPNGPGFTYPQSDAGAEPAAMTAVLAACDSLKVAFDQLLPESKRDWWENEAVRFNVVNGYVSTAEIVAKLKAKLDGCSLTRGQLRAVRPDLPADLFVVGTPDAFPPHYELGVGSDGDVVLDFGVATPTTAGRTYYGHPDGSVSCCAAFTLTLNQAEALVAHKDVPLGRVDVVLATHFKIIA